MKFKSDIFQFFPGIFFVLILFSPFYLPNLLYRFLPKYYAGDPSFSIEKHEELRKEIIQRYNQSFPDFSKKNLLFNTPPKLIDYRVESAMSLFIPFGILWGLGWSIYAFYNKATYKSKNIIWVTYLIFLIILIVTFVLWVLAMRNWNS